MNVSNTRKLLGDLLRGMGLSQQDAADRIGISQSQLCRILAGKASTMSRGMIKAQEWVLLNLDDVNDEEIVGAVKELCATAPHKKKEIMHILHNLMELL